MKTFEELFKEAEDNIEVNEESCWMELECPYFLGTDNCNLQRGECFQITAWMEQLILGAEKRLEEE